MDPFAPQRTPWNDHDASHFLPTEQAAAERRRLQARARRLASGRKRWRKKGAFAEAIVCQSEVTSLRPEDSVAFFRLGLLCREARRTDQAVQALRQATDLSPADRDPREALTETLVEASRYDEAVQEARALIKVVPRSLFARDVLSVSYLQLGRLDKALQVTGEMIWLDPLNPNHHFRRGLLFQQQGNSRPPSAPMAACWTWPIPKARRYEDAEEAMEELDDNQTRQILLLASEDRLFLLKLRRDLTEAVQERGFFLSEDGMARLSHLLPHEFPIGSATGLRLSNGAAWACTIDAVTSDWQTLLGKQTLVMGILNVTPDSFSDGGRYATVEAAVAHASMLVADGAHLLDIGGESTRPATFGDKSPLPPDEEKRRILPVIERLTAEMPHVPLSVDTYKAEVARAALDAGASLLNDISGLTYDPDMAALAAAAAFPLSSCTCRAAPVTCPQTPSMPMSSPTCSPSSSVKSPMPKRRASAATSSGSIRASASARRRSTTWNSSAACPNSRRWACRSSSARPARSFWERFWAQTTPTTARKARRPRSP